MNDHDISILNIHLFQTQQPSSDFYFSTIKAHLLNSHKHIEKPHKHDFYACMLFTKGSGSHEIDFQKYTVEPRSMFFMSPGQVHAWQLSDDIDGYIFFHSGPFYNLHYVSQQLRHFPFFGSIHTKRKLQLNAETCLEIAELFKTIGQEHFSQDKNSIDYKLTLVTQLYIKSLRLFSLNSEENHLKNSNYIQHYQNFETLIEENFRTEKSIAQYAEWLCISPKHLNRIAQSVVKKTASDVLTDRVILEAKRMLIHLDQNLSDIAFQLGYEEYSYFVRVFRKRTGQTPSEFIKTHKH